MKLLVERKRGNLAHRRAFEDKCVPAASTGLYATLTEVRASTSWLDDPLLHRDRAGSVFTLRTDSVG